MLRPTYTLTIGSLSSGTDDPVAGLTALVVERDMDVPADALRLHLRERARIAVGDAVTLELGHDGEEETVFTGAVEAVRPAIADVVVRALGTTNDLLNLRASATFTNQSAGSIARDLGSPGIPVRAPTSCGLTTSARRACSLPDPNATAGRSDLRRRSHNIAA